MEVLHTAPATSSFTPLSTHQSQTPESFFDGPPVLYHHSPSAILKTHASDLAAAPALAGLASGAQRSSNGTATTNGDGTSEEQDEEVEIRGVDIWVTSERLLLYSPAFTTGVSIPYPTISLHAIQSHPSSLFLQLLTSAQTFDDHDPDSTISLTLIPSPTTTASPLSPPAPTENPVPAAPPTPTESLYAALSACANLHPDPQSGSDSETEAQNPAIRFENIECTYPLNNVENTALPLAMPGIGRWITAENVGEFFDEEGNWRGGGEFTESEVLGVPGAGLGEGAGSVRTRGTEEEGFEEGGEDETKWRRTG